MKAWHLAASCGALMGCNLVLGNERASGVDPNFDGTVDAGPRTGALESSDAGPPASCSGLCVLATGIDGTPRSLAVDATNVYFTTEKEIHRVTHDGIGLTSWLSNVDETFGLLRSGDDLLFAQGAHAMVGRAKLADATARTNSAVASGPNHSYRALAVGGDRLYVTDVTASTVFRYDLQNWSAAPVAIYDGANDEPWDVVAVGADAYVTLRRGCSATGAVVRAQVQPTAPFADNERCPQGIAADDTGAVYWANGGAGGAIRRKGTSGAGAASTLASAQANPIAIAVDATFVYWANAGTSGQADGSIVRAKRVDGSGMQVLADKLAGPVALEVDTGAVYWLEAGAHRLMKLDKP